MAEQWMSLRRYAKHRGVRLSAVQKAIETGRVTAVKRNGAGRLSGIESAAADVQWAQNTDPVEAAKSGKVIVAPLVGIGEESTASAVSVEQGIGASANANANADAGTVDVDEREIPSSPNEAGGGKGGESGKDPGGFYAGRARRMQVQAEEAELDLLERKRLLVGTKETEDAVFGVFRQVRDRLQNISARIAPRLAAEADATRVDQLLNDEIAMVLDELSRDVEQFTAAGSA